MKHDFTTATTSAVLIIKNYFEAKREGNFDLAEDDLRMFKQLWWELTKDFDEAKPEKFGN